jgi:hypothetical protein
MQLRNFLLPSGTLFHYYSMDSQKVPGMVALYCNGTTYVNAYPNTFKVGPLHTHTHILGPLILPLLEALAKGFFLNRQEFCYCI